VGTSLGGLVGMVLAGSAGSPIERIVLNDIGPDVSSLAVARVGLRIGTMPVSFDSREHAEHYYRRAFATCGPMDDEQWRDFVSHSIQFDENVGRFRSRLDPKVAIAFSWLLYYRIPIWSYFKEIEARVMSVYGELSDFAPRSLIRDMLRWQPCLVTHEVTGVGHMPMLMSKPEIEAIAAFLSP
jgi:pimeloyl-ACP methyl ester carboxylesterase